MCVPMNQEAGEELFSHSKAAWLIPHSSAVRRLRACQGYFLRQGFFVAQLCFVRPRPVVCRPSRLDFASPWSRNGRSHNNVY